MEHFQFIQLRYQFSVSRAIQIWESHMRRLWTCFFYKKNLRLKFLDKKIYDDFDNNILLG